MAFKIFRWKLKPSWVFNAAFIATVVGLLVLLWFVVVLIVKNYINPSIGLSTSEASNVGEFIGGAVGAIWSFSAVLLLFITYKSQQKELKATRKTLKNQERINHLQQFENTFFNLLSAQNEIINSVQADFDTETRTVKPFGIGDPIFAAIKGRDLFKRIAEDIAKELLSDTFAHADSAPWKGWEKRRNKEYEANKLPDAPKFKKAGYNINFVKLEYVYTCQHELHRSSLSHYFRHLYHIIKFVNDHPSFERLYKDQAYIERVRYLKILRAQLSSYELVLLWYNSLHKFGSGFREYLFNYELLANIEFESTLYGEHELLMLHPYLRGPYKRQTNGGEVPSIDFNLFQDYYRQYKGTFDLMLKTPQSENSKNQYVIANEPLTVIHEDEDFNWHAGEQEWFTEYWYKQ